MSAERCQVHGRTIYGTEPCPWCERDEAQAEVERYREALEKIDWASSAKTDTPPVEMLDALMRVSTIVRAALNPESVTNESQGNEGKP